MQWGMEVKSAFDCPVFPDVKKEIDNQAPGGERMNCHWSRFDQEEGEEQQYDTFRP